jgi:hypothetical protein
MGTAEVSLIVSGAAVAGSIGAVVITYRLGRERFDHERRLSDVDSARRVLDDAASTMQRANSVLGSITTHMDAYASTLPGRLWNNELLRGDTATLESARDDLASLAGRLRIRFGAKHELITVYESAESIALGVAFYLELIGTEARSPEAAVDAVREKIDQAVRQFGVARDSFTLIAYRVVGAKLPAV